MYSIFLQNIALETLTPLHIYIYIYIYTEVPVV